MGREQLVLPGDERREARANSFGFVEQRLEDQHVAGARERLRVGERRLGRGKVCGSGAAVVRRVETQAAYRARLR